MRIENKYQISRNRFVTHKPMIVHHYFRMLYVDSPNEKVLRQQVSYWGKEYHPSTDNIENFEPQKKSLLEKLNHLLSRNTILDEHYESFYFRGLGMVEGAYCTIDDDVFILVIAEYEALIMVLDNQIKRKKTIFSCLKNHGFDYHISMANRLSIILEQRVYEV